MSLPVGDPRHGTVNGYGNLGCRCESCRVAHTAYFREWRNRTGRTQPRADYVAAVRAAAEARDNHGTETRYSAGCRCDACRAAQNDARRRRRHENLEETRAYDRAYRARRRAAA